MRCRHLGLVVLLVAIGLAGCATPYQHEGITGGFTEQKINDSAYVVSFSGNGFAGADRVWYFWVYRCAELTRQAGYELFTIRAPRAPGAALLRERPEPASEGGDPGDGRFIKVAGGVVAVPIYGGGIEKFAQRGTVLMFHTPLPAEVLWTMDAQKVLDLLKPYVTSDGKEAAPARAELYRLALVAHERIDLGPGLKAEGPDGSPAPQEEDPAAPHKHPGHPFLGVPTGPRTLQEMSSILTVPVLTALHAIYREHAARGPDAGAGVVILTFTVTANGLVKDPQILASSFTDRVFVQDLVQLVGGITFPPRNTTDTHVELPLSFSTAEAPPPAPQDLPSKPSST